MGENDTLVETTASFPKTVNILWTVWRTTEEIYEEIVSSRDYCSREAILYWRRKYSALLMLKTAMKVLRKKILENNIYKIM